MEQVYHFVEMFEKSIGLKAPWKVTKAEFDPKGKSVHVYVESSKTAQYPCPECGRMSHRYDDEEQERIWRHADVVMYPCYVHSRRPRVNCTDHGIHVVEAPWARKGARQTLLFEGYAMMLAETMTLNEARKVLRISRTALMHMVEYWVNKAVSEDDLGGIRKLSIDETSFQRGQSYVTVFGDPVRRRVIGVEEGRDISVVERFSMDFMARGGDCEGVGHVSMDMSNTYKQGCGICFPAAKVVFDRFHVKKLVLDGMDEVRREEQGRAYAKSRRAGRKLLMIPESRMTRQQEATVMAICKEYPRTGRAFRMVQQMDDAYRSRTPEEAGMLLGRLTSWMMHSRLAPMKRVARTIRQYQKEILEYFESRLTNAFAEGMNSLIQAAKRKARGFKTFKGYRIMIYLTVGKLQLSYPSCFENFSRS